MAEQRLQFDVAVDASGAIAAFGNLSRALGQLSGQSAGPALAGGAAAATTMGKGVNAATTSVKGMEGALGQLQKTLGGFGGDVLKVASSLTGATIGVMALDKAMRLVLDTFSRGSELLNLSRSTGQTVGDLVTMQKALASVGMSGESLRMYLMMLDRSVSAARNGAGGAAKAFALMGLSISSLEKMSAKERLAAIADGLQNITSQTEKTRAMRDIFGRSGPQLQAALKDETFVQKIKGDNGGYAELMQRNAKMFDSVKTGLDALNSKFKEVGAVFAEAIGPMLDEMLKAFKSVDGVEAGKNFVVVADALKMVITYISLGIEAIKSIMGLFGQNASAAAALAKAFVAIGVAMAALGISKLLQKIAETTTSFVKSALGIKAHTQALNENTAAQEANAAASSRASAANMTDAFAAAKQPKQTAGASANEVENLGKASKTTGRSLSQMSENAGAAQMRLTGMQLGLTTGTTALGGFSAAGLMAAANIGLFIGVLATSVIVKWIAELNDGVAQLKNVERQADELRQKIKDMPKIETVEQRDTALKERAQDVKMLAEQLEVAKEKQQELFQSDFKQRYDLKGADPAFVAWETNQQRLAGRDIIQDEKGDYYQGSEQSSLKMGSIQARINTLNQSMQAQRQAQLQLLLTPKESLAGGGGYKDVIDTQKVLTGANNNINNMLDPENAAKLQQRIAKIAEEMSRITQDKYKLFIELSNDPAEKIRLLRQQAQELVKDFNKSFDENGKQDPEKRKKELVAFYTNEAKTNADIGGGGSASANAKAIKILQDELKQPNLTGEKRQELQAKLKTLEDANKNNTPVQLAEQQMAVEERTRKMMADRKLDENLEPTADNAKMLMTLAEEAANKAKLLGPIASAKEEKGDIKDSDVVEWKALLLAAEKYKALAEQISGISKGTVQSEQALAAAAGKALDRKREQAALQAKALGNTAMEAKLNQQRDMAKATREYEEEARLNPYDPAKAQKLNQQIAGLEAKGELTPQQKRELAKLKQERDAEEGKTTSQSTLDSLTAQQQTLESFNGFSVFANDSGAEKAAKLINELAKLKGAEAAGILKPGEAEKIKEIEAALQKMKFKGKEFISFDKGIAYNEQKLGEAEASGDTQKAASIRKELEVMKEFNGFEFNKGDFEVVGKLVNELVNLKGAEGAGVLKPGEAERIKQIEAALQRMKSKGAAGADTSAAAAAAAAQREAAAKLTPEQKAAKDVALKQVAAEAEGKLAKEKTDNEIAVLELQARGDTAGAARLERTQKLNALTKEYAALLQKANNELTDEEAQTQGLAMAQRKLNAEKQEQLLSMFKQSEIETLRGQGEEGKAAALEFETQRDERFKQLSAAGYTGLSADEKKEMDALSIKKSNSDQYDALKTEANALQSKQDAGTASVTEQALLKEKLELMAKLKESGLSPDEKARLELLKAQSEELIKQKASADVLAKTSAQMRKENQSFELLKLRSSGLNDMANDLEKEMRIDDKVSRLNNAGAQARFAEEIRKDDPKLSEEEVQKQAAEEVRSMATQEDELEGNLKRKSKPPERLTDQFRQIGGTLDGRNQGTGRAGRGGGEMQRIGDSAGGVRRLGDSGSGADFINLGGTSGDTYNTRGFKSPNLSAFTSDRAKAAVAAPVPVLTRDQLVQQQMLKHQARIAKNTEKPGTKPIPG